LKLNRFALRHYRNYSEVDLTTDGRVNIFIGNNAQGKTNLLEAIYVLALTKSHRTAKDRELIAWQEEKAIVHGEIERKYGGCKLDLTLSSQGKKAKLNGLEQRKLSDYVGGLNVVMFAPEDLEIVKGSPSIRRRFLDMEIAQVEPSYLHHLLQYQKVLHQRNQLLKQPNAAKQSAMLEVWNEQFVTYGTKIIQKRQSFIKKLEKWASSIHASIAGGKEHLQLHYKASLEVEDFTNGTILFERFMIKLTQAKEQELRRGTTLVGPHRDDLTLSLDGREVHAYGSQGQQRTAALSLKLAEIELIAEEVGEYPILLLDDVLSELDRHRQTQLIETFQDKVQTFITTTGVESVDLSRWQDAAFFHVENGNVSVDKR